jgi:multiple sugar transport system substrate-binding protein
MRRLATGAVLSAALLLGLGGVASGASRSPAAGKATTITIWVGWSGATHELKVFKRLVAEYDAKHPEVNVNVVGDINDDKIIAAIRGGNVPDVVSSFASSNVGSYCSSGGWIDLGPLLKQDHVNINQFPAASRYYTQYNGTRCALPLLADCFGLYYNKTLFKQAGITRPPRTFSELTADAKKLTQKNADGALKVVGYDPASAFYDDVPPKFTFYAPLFGAHYTDAKGRSILSKDPAWTRFYRWQKSLVDWYGYDKLQRFQAGLGQEFSSTNGFETGKLAMMIDGEWRVAFIQREHPELDYGTAPMPVDDAHPNLYGAGYINGTIIGIPRGVKHEPEAWALVKYLTTNSHFLAQFSNGIRNVPSTTGSLDSPEIKPDPHFSTFLKIFANPHSATTPITAVGAGYQDLMQAFIVKWQAGHVSNLAAGLKDLDKQIDAQLAHAKKGGGGPP